MNLEKIMTVKRDNSKLEAVISESLAGASEELELFQMGCDFVINTMNISKRNAEETAVAFNELFGMDEINIAKVITFSFEVSALQFWSQIIKEEASEEAYNEMKDVIENVDSEVERCKDIMFYYLVKGIDGDSFEGQAETFRKNFNISEEFHKALEEYLLHFHGEIMEQIVLKLTN